MQDYLITIEMFMIVLIGFMNIYTCHLYYRDKQYSQTNQYRISERKLLRSSFLLGGIGAFLGMRIFRHKTKHLKFQLLIPVAAIFTLAVWSWLVFEIVRTI